MGDLVRRPNVVPDVIPVQRKYRNKIPESHRGSLDTRLVWLWHQRFGTVQTIYKDSPDVLDKTACTLILQAILASDLESISQLFQRLEGGALNDEALLDRDTIRV
jgi:hypothetical protein